MQSGFVDHLSQAVSSHCKTVCEDA